MTTPVDGRPLPRPTVAAPGPEDDRFLDLVEARFRRIVDRDPVAATYFGLHDADDSLGDGTRDAVLDDIASDRAHLAAVEAIDPVGLSPEIRFERDLERHNVTLDLFEADDIRRWERRPAAFDVIGDGLFLLFARDHAPLADRLRAITGRLEAAPDYLTASTTRAVGPQVRLWVDLAIEMGEDLPSLLDEIETAGRTALDARDQRRLERAAAAARVAIELHLDWLRGRLPDADDRWAMGRDGHDAMVALRAFDGLDADAILALGWEQLAAEKAARAAAAREIDPNADEATVLASVKANHPADFEGALAAYRTAMLRSRAHLIERDLVTVPNDERIDVIATPEYLRNVLPFAAYFQPAPFDADPKGVYVVTPSVGNDPKAMGEHNLASISNTSIHEAYPGHHLQLDAARRSRSLTRLLTAAPEFEEGWGMYSELMMREHGFDDGPAFRLMLHTDAIWRACRIILDIRMHRGELSVDEGLEFLAEQTGFARNNARAEVCWYTHRPTYPLSYLLGRTLILGLRADEQRRLGSAFSLKGFHDTLMRNASLPVSFHRRALAGEG